MKYLLLGDVHANWAFMASFIHDVMLRRIDFDEIIQVGDLGYYEDRIKLLPLYLKKINKPFHFIDGNHESHHFLDRTHTNLHKHGIFYHSRGDITVLPDGTKIGWMGGAFNVDRPQEFFGGSQNFPKKEEIDAFVTKVNTLGGVDLLLTHSCPHSIGIGMQGHPGFTPTIHEYIEKLGYQIGNIWDCGDQPLTNMWNGLTTKPLEVIFGHFHSHHHAVVAGTTHFRCIGTCDGTIDPRVYIYDSSTKKVMG